MGLSSTRLNNIMKLVVFLSFLNQLKIFHWQTFSYSQHKALGKSYETLDGLFDNFVETYYGKYGKTLQAKIYNFEADALTPETDVKKFISNKKRDLINYLRNEVISDKDEDLKNIVDEIEGELNHLQYLLELS
jgi:hypothetical protein